MKEEKGKIYELKEYANNRSTIEMKNEVEKDYTEEILKRKKEREQRKLQQKRASRKKWIAGTLATIALAGIIAGVRASKENEPIIAETTTQYAESINTTENIIDTIDEVKKDFTEHYLEAYNKKYGTSYKSAELLVTALRDGAVYELDDGRVVTRGSKPYETEATLNQIGNFEMKNGYNNVVQIISNGRTLGTYNLSTGEFIYSGNQLEDLKNKGFEEPTLEELGIDVEKMIKAAEVVKSKGVEGKESVDQRIKAYNQVVDGEER